MISFEITHFDSEKSENVILFYYCIRLRHLDDQSSVIVWIKKIDDIFKIEVEDLPKNVKQEALNKMMGELFEHVLTKSKYRVQATAENWKERGYSLENTE